MIMYDVIVVGGGFAGVSAAISAAREGMRVLLIDKNNCLGGAATECLVNPFMPYWTMNEDQTERVFLTQGIFSEIYDCMDAFGGIHINRITFDEECLKLVLCRMVQKENIDLLFHSYLIDAQTQDGVVKSITVANKSGKQTFSADYFIDATGDGDLSVLCGCDFQLGRTEDQLCQPMTLCFRLLGVNEDLFASEKPRLQELYKEYQAQGKIKNPRENILCFPTMVHGLMHFNTTRIVKKNPTDAADITSAELSAREQVFEMLSFLKENSESFKNARLLMTASHIGVRESRMIEGEYILTQEDLLAFTKFEDGIAVCNYEIDIHNPEGSGTSHYFFPNGEYYSIPYRCLTPKKTHNLLVAGRCISSTHEAQASYRIMPVCASLGEAAGIAAALAKKASCSVKSIDIPLLRKTIQAHGGRVD